MIYGEGSCCSKLSKCWELREKDGGMYTDHIVISLSRVTERAVVCSSVFVGKMILQILQRHLRALDNQYEYCYI